MKDVSSRKSEGEMREYVGSRKSEGNMTRLYIAAFGAGDTDIQLNLMQPPQHQGDHSSSDQDEIYY